MRIDETQADLQSHVKSLESLQLQTLRNESNYFEVFNGLSQMKT